MDEKAASRSGFPQSLLRHPLFKLFIGTLLIALGTFVIPQAVQTFANAQGENVVLAWEMTARFFLSPKFGPDNVLLSPELEDLAEQEGISENDLRNIIAGSANESDPEKGLFWPYLAADLAGLSRKESSYCTDLGSVVAYFEIQAVLSGSWRLKNLRALEDIANNLGVDVYSIMGSIGGGAISCFQLLPYNWQKYGGGDYRDSFPAAMNSASFLKDHGYDWSDEGFETALARYNPSGGQAYIDDVVEFASIWDGIIGTAIVMEPVPVNLITIPMVFLEYMAFLMSGGVEAPIAGEFTDPYPGSVVCGNPFAAVLSPTYIHWAVDKCLPGNATGTVVAPHAGGIVFSGFVKRTDPRAWNQLRDDYISSSGNLVILEGELPDGRWIRSVLTHLNPATMPSVGAVFDVGDQVAMTQCSFTPDEYCTAHHLHWALKIEGDPIDGGMGVNPMDLLK